MRLTFLLFFLIFFLLPPDAQRWLASLLRDLIVTQQGGAMGAGALGATFAAMFWYGLGWNGAVDTVYLEDMTRAKESHHRRRR